MAWNVAMGVTFRDAYDIGHNLSSSTSSSLSRWGGFPSHKNRQQANSAFSSFLRTIEYPSSEKISSMFTCSTCEKQNEEGKSVLRAVVLDGTATGVLGKLPAFRRPMTKMKAPENIGRW